MRKLKEVLRLKFECSLKNRAIARAANISASTVSYYIRAFQQSDLNWPLAQDFSDADLIQALEPYCTQLRHSKPTKQEPDFAKIHQELKRKEITLYLLWEEYRTTYPNQAYSYAEYCRRYRCWKKQCQPSMRHTYKAGEKCFVDYAGPKVPIYHAESGQPREAVIFIGVLGASNYTFAEATWTRSLPDWLESHQRMFEFWGGVPEMIIPDNEKAGVQSACYYDPELNPQYCAFAAHYQTTVLPTRPGHPRDKAKVETAVQIVERWILARLRHYQFFSLTELNETINYWLDKLNQKAFKKLPGTRQSLFESLERCQLKPLPKHPYEYAEIKRAQVRLDYHIEVDNHFYSVPHQHISKIIEYRLTSNLVEIYYQGQRIASHVRSFTVGGHTCVPEHMPKSHYQHQHWTPQTFLDWAKQIGTNAEAIVNQMIATQNHAECCYRIYLGFLNCVKRYGQQRVEQACCYAQTIQAYRFRSIRSILQTNLDQHHVIERTDDETDFQPPEHTYVRGAHYYQT